MVTTYSAFQIMAFWEQAGGPPATSMVMCAVSLAESGGRDDAVSPSNDYGLWQINSSNFGGYTGLNFTNWSDPLANARAAVIMSSAGTNVAAWCTCWQNPVRDCGHGYLTTPQVGTPAYDKLLLISQDTGTPVPGTNINPGAPTAITPAWGEMQDALNSQIPAQWANIGALTNILRSVT